MSWERAPGRNSPISPAGSAIPRCEVVAICDVEQAKADEFAAQFDIPLATDDWQGGGQRSRDRRDRRRDAIAHPLSNLSWAALEAGKHVLCEKPVAYDFRETAAPPKLARSKGLKTKLGFTFRYSPGVQYAKSLIDEGFIGTPFIFNGYEQNSQWLNPQTPLRQVDHTADQSLIQTSSLEGYGAPIIDIGHWWVGADYTRVVGTMRNFIPERMVRATGQMMRMNIDDGDIYIGEYANGAIGSIQTSFVTVGNYPGIEARIYGCERRDHLPPDRGVRRRRDDQGRHPRRRRVQADGDPERVLPDGRYARESWRSLFYANLIKDFIIEILDGDDRNQGNFDDGAWVQEAINAVELSFHERRWVDLPLES